MEFSYYPGCTLTGSAKELDESFRNAAWRLGVNLKEIPDWSCCGASSAHMVDAYLEYALPARDLMTAERLGHDVVAPCAGCHVRMKASQKHIMADKDLHRRFPMKGDINVLSGLDLFGRPELVSLLKERVARPLKDLRVVPYYGCLAVRPLDVVEPANPENPMQMDRILEALGATVLKWPYKTDCCGGSLALANTDMVLKLSGKILDMAKLLEADALVTMCPMCQANLDTRQTDIAKKTAQVYNMPIMYVTELMGIAFQDAKVKNWMERHIVSPQSMLSRRGLL
jgi:heterodisulfide reductase subunit B